MFIYLTIGASFLSKLITFSSLTGQGLLLFSIKLLIHAKYNVRYAPKSKPLLASKALRFGVRCDIRLCFSILIFSFSLKKRVLPFILSQITSLFSSVFHLLLCDNFVDHILIVGIKDLWAAVLNKMKMLMLRQNLPYLVYKYTDIIPSVFFWRFIF